MSLRLPACDPCQRAKLACNHEQPTCARCRGRGQGGVCVYRANPFKRKQLHNEPQNETSPIIDETSALSPSPSSRQQRHYPNPGFLGSSSHSAIFKHVSSSTNHDNAYSPPDTPIQATEPSSVDIIADQAILDRGSHTLSLLGRTNVSRLKSLVDIWLGNGVNLPLAGPLVARCAQAVYNMAERLTPRAAKTADSSARCSPYSEILLRNSLRPITLRRDSTATDFFSQMLGENMRWETLGIFFAAATRAVLDTASFPLLYSTEEQRHKLIKLLTRIGDDCLETCLGLDCLNELQLVLQYENFIVHSQVYGDQSYHSWRRMGDISSSLFALGYHEKIDEDNSQIPQFIAELRKAAFARIYSADKNLAVFLGRPPRITKAYCNFQVPCNIPGLWDDGNIPTITSSGLLPSDNTDQHDPGNTEIINYTADTRCSAMFASLKEDILELFREASSNLQVEKATAIRLEAEKQWQMLPACFKLKTSLKDCQLSPFERDFLVGTRLDHLHTLFLLHLVSLRHVSEPDDSLLTVAGEMLSHVVEVIILRDRLVNSGTCLIWKVAHFGLPAAGVISLALLNPSIGRARQPYSRSKMLQDLTVLTAEVRIGAVIQAGEPNFALFTRATRTIQSLLQTLMGGEFSSRLTESDPIMPQQLLNSDLIEAWDPWINTEPWDFEIDFWANLAEHPSLQGSGHGIEARDL